MINKSGKYAEASKYLGLGLSFGVTMLVNVFIGGMAGRWLDKLLGTNDIFWLIGVLCGIYAGFHLFIEQIEQMQNPQHPNERE